MLTVPCMGGREVKVRVLRKDARIAVHRSIHSFREWTLTHIPTRFAIASFPSKKNALEAMKRVAALDWDALKEYPVDKSDRAQMRWTYRTPRAAALYRQVKNLLKDLKC